MAFSLSWMTRCVVTVVVVVMLSLTPWSLRVVRAEVSVNCGVCEKSRCPELHYCEEGTVKDHCGCCDVCSKEQPHPHGIGSSDDDHVGDDNSREGNACAKVKCPKFKVCMENMQGLPLCTCPGPFICRQRRSRQRDVCGTDGVTYQSRCHLRIAACNSATRIKVARRGPCTGAEGPRPRPRPRHRACDSLLKSCWRRKNQNPVCGTDGKTYQSRCHMKVAACQKGVKVKMRHHGRCSSSSSSSSSSSAGVVSSPGRGSVALSTALPTRISANHHHHHHHQQPPARDVSRSRKDRRHRKKKKQGGSDVSGKEEGGGKRKRRKQQQQRREKRKQRQQRRRKRRKTRGGQYRGRRYKSMDKRQVRRNIGHSN